MNNKNTILDNLDYSNNIGNNNDQLINSEQQNYEESNSILDNFDYSNNIWNNNDQLINSEQQIYEESNSILDNFDYSSNIGNNEYNSNQYYFDDYNNQNNINNEKYNNGSLSTYYENGNMYYNNDKNSFNAYYTENNFLTNNTIQNKLNQKEVSKRYFNTNPPHYKIRNLSTLIKSRKNEEPAINLVNLNFDIFPKDHIVLLSDDKKYVSLFINIMKNNVERSSGFIFDNKKTALDSIDNTKLTSSNTKNNKLVPNDVYEGKKIKCEKNNLSNDSFLDINYKKFIKFKNKSIKFFLNKILSYYKKEYDKKILLNFFDTFKLTNILDEKIDTLSLFEKNRFFLLCNILVEKKIIYINDISNDLDLNEKIKFDRFLNNYFSDKNTILFITCNDLTEIKILANRAFVFSHDILKNDDYFVNIMKYYESIDDYIVLNTKK